MIQINTNSASATTKLLLCASKVLVYVFMYAMEEQKTSAEMYTFSPTTI